MCKCLYRLIAFDQENALLFAQPICYDWVYQSHDISIVPFEDNQILQAKCLKSFVRFRHYFRLVYLQIFRLLNKTCLTFW